MLTTSVAMRLPLQVLGRSDGGILRHGQDPAGGLAGGLAELELADFVHLGAVFHDPIVAGNAAVQVAVLDVAADLLRADEADHQLLVIDVGHVGTAADLDMKAGLGHFGDGRFLQAALGQTQF